MRYLQEGKFLEEAEKISLRRNTGSSPEIYPTIKISKRGILRPSQGEIAEVHSAIDQVTKCIGIGQILSKNAENNLSQTIRRQNSAQNLPSSGGLVEIHTAASNLSGGGIGVEGIHRCTRHHHGGGC